MKENAKFVLFTCAMVAMVIAVVAVVCVVVTLGWIGKKSAELFHLLPKDKTDICITHTAPLTCTGTPEMVSCWREHRDI